MAEAAEASQGRWMLGGLGALAGLAAWVLFGVLPQPMAAMGLARLHLFLAAFGTVFFGAGLAMVGALRPGRALGAAAGLGLPLAGLLTWASLRFDTVAAFLGDAVAVPAFAALLVLATPFAIAGLSPGGRWFDYAALFTRAWQIVVRMAAAWLFVGLVWGILFLSNALFGLVGIGVIEWLLDFEAVPYLVTGLTLGVALAVVGERSDYVSPDLVLGLFRLLLPVVLAVVAVFLAALPARGIGQLFGGLSAASILMAMVFGSVTLISSAADAADDRLRLGAVTGWSARLLALLLPFLAGLAGIAIAMRLRQYGATPDRLLAAALAVLAMGYGLGHAGAVLRAPGWAARVRRVNVGMALAAAALAAALLTPVFDPQRISAANQLARYDSGRVAADGLDLWTLGHDWGRAGRAALDRLAERAGGDPKLAEQLAALDAAETRADFELARRGADSAADRAALARTLPVRPAGAALPEGFLSSLRSWELQQIGKACKARTPQGNPACVALLADLSQDRPGDEIVILAQGPGEGPLLRAYFADGDSFSMRSPDYVGGDDLYRDAAAAIDALLAGRYDLRPMRLNAVEVEGRTLFFGR
ncbi:DUF4153 domain-containing protein [Rhodovulum visakhapatnamense]|uniref:Uncharacterized protein DUF4153 n=1 Tax=Rhodovulum visakhapatnamense TaxID=364297 RepID=A0A4R8FWT6_9RHOB|nr:DUF4153 domain-containing protein [Rhodovulum visakhapatnamense]TDX28542.1 uncharacterized protein DUF4153 [Rhodovulum visakhapatnamense]